MYITVARSQNGHPYGYRASVTFDHSATGAPIVKVDGATVATIGPRGGVRFHKGTPQWKKDAANGALRSR